MFYFQVHQPKRLRRLRFFEIGNGHEYFDEEQNREIIQRVAERCYLPANALLAKLIKRNPEIKIAFSISGLAIEQFEAHAPEVIDSFRALAQTGSVDFLTETYYHSLSSLMPGNEFELQVAKHQKLILRTFGVLSKVFRNTELIYSDETGLRVSKLGFRGVMIDGAEKVLGQRSPHHVYSHPEAPTLKLLTRDYRLSDDIAFRFSCGEKSLDASQYISWLESIPADEQVINVGMDFETFGEHHKKESGIFSFLEKLMTGLAQHKRFRFMTPSQVVEELTPIAKLPTPGFISWADQERDVSAWLGNEMQRDAFDSILRIESDVKMLLDKKLLHEWRTLQTSDHFYYMCTKKGSDGLVHSYFSPYPSPYEAFINYMNVLTDLDLKLKTLRAATLSHGGQMIRSSDVLLMPAQ